jgi:tetratricopeptide (TPR) repeat protein
MRRLVVWTVTALLCSPLAASAQREQFFDAVLPFYVSLAGVYGDEGPQLTEQLETLSDALARWDRALDESAANGRERLKEADAHLALQVHVTLASLYAERSRYEDALREIDEGLRIDSSRSALHRFRALLLLASKRPADAADAFRNAWIADPADAQNAYQLIVHPSDSTTPEETEKAAATLASLERDLVRGLRGSVSQPFFVLNSINDDAGGGLGFIPAAYSRGLSMLLNGQFDESIKLLRAAVAADPLVTDPALRSEAMVNARAALREGRIAAAIASLQAAVASSPGSSEAHRLLGTAYRVDANVAKSVEHFRQAVQLNPRDERSWLALARVLDSAGELEEALAVLRKGVSELPDSGAITWALSLTAARRQRTDEFDIQLMANVERFALIAGKGDLYGRVARLAYGHLNYERAVELLEKRVILNPNVADAHKSLGRAYVEQGREDVGYAELVIALLLDASDADTLATIGQLHLSSGRVTEAIETLTRAATVDPSNLQAVRGLGNALIRVGKTAEGRERLTELERLLAADVERHRKQRTTGMFAVQAEVQVREGNYDAAADLWKQVIELESDRPAHYVRLAEALIGAGRMDQAAAQLQLAIARGAGPDAHRRLADVYDASGRTEEGARERRIYVERQLQQLRGLSSDETDPVN